MPTPISLHHTIFVPVKVVIPDQCPHCDAPFTTDSNLIEWDATEVQFRGRADPRPGALYPFVVNDELERGETFHPVAFFCASCRRPLHEARSARLPAFGPSNWLSRLLLLGRR